MKKGIKKIQKFIIRDDIYKTEVLFVVNCDSESFVKTLKNYGVEPKTIGNYVCGTVIRARNEHFRAVWIQKFSIKNFAETIHELFHLVTIICQDKQIPIKANIESGECGDEAAAYMLEFYTGKCLEELKITKNPSNPPLH